MRYFYTLDGSWNVKYKSLIILILYIKWRIVKDVYVRSINTGSEFVNILHQIKFNLKLSFNFITGNLILFWDILLH